MEKWMKHCELCPRRCGADRTKGPGRCGGGEKVRVALADLHQWEEPCISVGKGSGAVFFCGCCLGCVYCQNYRISAGDFGAELTVEDLAQTFRALEERGACNLNLVTPTHYTPQIVQALSLAKPSVPVVYNCSGYERVETLRSLEGVVDVYLTDLKYYDPQVSGKYSGAPDYFEVASRAVKEMARQAGEAVFDGGGRMVRGVIIRHLVLPGLTDESRKLLRWIRRELPDTVYISLMNQYFPAGEAWRFPELSRRVTTEEYEETVDELIGLGFENGFLQEEGAAEEEYVPSFDLRGIVRAGGQGSPDF